MAPGRAIVKVVEQPLQVAKLRVESARERSRRRRRQLDADGIEDPQQHCPGGIVPLDLPTADVAPVRPYGSGELLLRKAGMFA